MKTYTRFNVVSQKIITGFLILILGISYVSPASAGTLQSSRVIASLAQTFDCGTVSEIPQTECEALVAFYNSTNGANWLDNTNWLQTDTPCQWYGVMCAGGSIVMLTLYDNQLSGSIPAELSNLPNLQGLDLSFNQLNGGIPPELGSLSILWSLELSGNQLNGSIPVELGSLLTLRYLSLYNNQLSDSIPVALGDLTNLQHINLSGNQLSGGIPAELGSLPGLQTLRVSGNQLSGNIPAELGSLSNLQQLDLSNNQLSGNIPVELGSLLTLQTLYLDNNQLSGGIPAELGSLLNLQSLYLYSNQLSGGIPIELGNLSSLHGLSLSDNQLSGSIPVELGNLSNLWGIDFNYNQLSGNIPAELGSLSNLQNLELAYNQLSDGIPPELGNLSNLWSLDLSYNQLSGNIPPELGGLSNFWSLNLSNNHLSGSIPLEFGNLPRLQTLDLSGNLLSGSVPTVVGNLSKLQWLDLSNNLLTGNIPPELSQLDVLWHLGLGGNQLTGSIPPELGNLTNLVNLNLAYNQLGGNIPPELGGLPHLGWLYLDSNQLTGSIPPELGNLTELRILFLNHNQLTGNIPPELGNLSNLGSLSLAFNQLTGNIPAALGSLSELASLNLENNQLTGSIPTELGDLTMLEYLTLENTALSGEIPASITSLNNLYDLTLSCGLTSSDSAVISFIDGILGPGWDVDCLPAPEIIANAGPSPVGAMDMDFGWGRWMYVNFSEMAGGGGSLYLDPVSQFFTQYGQPLNDPASLNQLTYSTYIDPYQTTNRWYWMSLPVEVVDKARALDQYAIVWRTTFSGNTDAYESFSSEAYALIVLQPEDFGKVSPADVAVWQPTDVTLQWDSTVGATNYEYCFDTTDNGVCNSPDGWLGTYNTNATVSGLEPDTTYYWQARAVNTAGATAADSPKWWSFTTQSAPPVVDSIQLADFTPTSAASVDFKVTFSEAVTGVDAGDFMFDATGTLSGNVVTNVSPDTGPAAVYIVTVDTSSGSGMLRLDVKGAGTNIQTPDGRAFKGDFTSGEAYEIVPGGMISGVIFQADGVTPVENMAVSLVTTTGEERAKACGDGNGQFKFNSVPYGVAWHVSAVPDWRCNGQPEDYTHEFWQNTHSRDEAVVVVLSENLPNYNSILFTLDQGKSISGIVGAGGGSVATDNVGINIPATSIASDTIFTITDGGTQYHITTDEGYQDVILSATIGPEGTTFAQPATLTFQWPDADNDGVVDGTAYLESDLYLSKDGVMIAGPCAKDIAQCDTTANKFTVQVSSLSEFVVGPTSVAPSVTSVTLVNGNPTGAASVGFTVKFSEAVSGVDASDFSITKTGSITGYTVTGITPASGSADTYTVTVATGQNSGTLKLDVLNNGSIKDSAKNPLISEFTSGDAYSVTKIYSSTLLSQASYDGFILENSETSNQGGTKNNRDKLLYVGDDARNRQYRSILSFNTANIPANAQITKVTLKVKRSGVVGGGNPIKTFRGFVVDIKQGNFGTAALALSDFQAKSTKAYGSFKPALSGGWYNIDLTSGKGYLNRSGTTQIRLGFKLDDNNNSVANYLKLYSGNAGAYSPQLIVEYNVP